MEPSAKGAPASLIGRSHAVIGGTKCALDIHEAELADGVAGPRQA
jgi:hypothetical protein